MCFHCGVPDIYAFGKGDHVKEGYCPGLAELYFESRTSWTVFGPYHFVHIVFTKNAKEHHVLLFGEQHTKSVCPEPERARFAFLIRHLTAKLHKKVILYHENETSRFNHLEYNVQQIDFADDRDGGNNLHSICCFLYETEFLTMFAVDTRHVSIGMMNWEIVKNFCRDMHVDREIGLYMNSARTVADYFLPASTPADFDIHIKKEVADIELYEHHTGNLLMDYPLLRLLFNNIEEEDTYHVVYSGDAHTFFVRDVLLQQPGYELIREEFNRDLAEPDFVHFGMKDLDDVGPKLVIDERGRRMRVRSRVTPIAAPYLHEE